MFEGSHRYSSCCPICGHLVEAGHFSMTSCLSHCYCSILRFIATGLGRYLRLKQIDIPNAISITVLMHPETIPLKMTVGC